MEKFKSFYKSWWYLNEHSEFKNPEYDIIGDYQGNDFSQCLCIDVQKVNPITRYISFIGVFNLRTEVWLECGGFIYDEHSKEYTVCHDYRLDCGAKTFEKAIIKLANLVYKNFGK